jgi:hypothetical protein
MCKFISSHVRKEGPQASFAFCFPILLWTSHSLWAQLSLQEDAVDCYPLTLLFYLPPRYTLVSAECTYQELAKESDKLTFFGWCSQNNSCQSSGIFNEPSRVQLRYWTISSLYLHNHLIKKILLLSSFYG